MRNFIFMLFVFFTACQSPAAEEATTFTPERIEREVITMSDPANMMGTDFFNYFIALYKREQYSTMIQLTASESIQKHGRSTVADFYKNTFNLGEQGNYTLFFKLCVDSTHYNLKYRALTNNQVEKIITIPVINENDTIKLVLPDSLNNFFYNFAKK